LDEYKTSRKVEFVSNNYGYAATINKFMTMEQKNQLLRIAVKAFASTLSNFSSESFSATKKMVEE
jgi:hypothetical protein